MRPELSESTFDAICVKKKEAWLFVKKEKREGEGEGKEQYKTENLPRTNLGGVRM